MRPQRDSKGAANADRGVSPTVLKEAGDLGPQLAPAPPEHGPSANRVRKTEVFSVVGMTGFEPATPTSRRDFAQYLREYGVEANATERAVRGSHHQNRKDGIFQATRRGESSLRETRRVGGSRACRGWLRAERGKAQLVETRRNVERAWPRPRRSTPAGRNERPCGGCQAACRADADRTDGARGNSVGSMPAYVTIRRALSKGTAFDMTSSIFSVPGGLAE